jgi:hypothetical protein
MMVAPDDAAAHHRESVFSCSGDQILTLGGTSRERPPCTGTSPPHLHIECVQRGSGGRCIGSGPVNPLTGQKGLYPSRPEAKGFIGTSHAASLSPLDTAEMKARWVACGGC